jgi:hypothetical protein
MDNVLDGFSKWPICTNFGLQFWKIPQVNHIENLAYFWVGVFATLSITFLLEGVKEVVSALLKANDED